MKDSRQIQAPAKINLYLGVYPQKDQRGYHRVDSVMAPIDLFDTITIRPAQSFSLDCEPEICADPSLNSVWRAASAMSKTFARPVPYAVHIQKNIPPKSGLGGASTDAANFIRFLCEEWQISLSDPRVSEIARSIGADVPFFLQDKVAYFDRAGDIFSRGFAEFPQLNLLLLRPRTQGISAKEGYEEFDKQPLYPKTPQQLFALIEKNLAPQKFAGRSQAGQNHLRQNEVDQSQIRQNPDAQNPDAQNLVQQMLSLTIENLAQTLFNNLGEAAARIEPELSRALAWLESQPESLAALVTGSGNCCYAVCTSQKDAQVLFAKVMEVEKNPLTHHGWWVRTAQICTKVFSERCSYAAESRMYAETSPAFLKN